jgi:phosphomannomutase
MNIFLFDVDGTLTPSRRKINPTFRDFFLDFCNTNYVCLVTGSDYSKTLEQLDAEILDKVEYVFNCSGNDVRKKDKNIYTSSWTISQEAQNWLEQELSKSSFSIRSGNHLEARPGSLNFSVVGRNANEFQRLEYVKYDEVIKEREDISNRFNNLFSDLYACVGGETGIDIFEKGNDKSQIVKYFSKQDKLYFFGDKMSPGGNDYPLGKVITESKLGDVFAVNDWKHTYKILNILSNVVKVI